MFTDIEWEGVGAKIIMTKDAENAAERTAYGIRWYFHQTNSCSAILSLFGSFATKCLQNKTSLGPQMWYSAIMTSSNGNIYRVTGHLCGEFTGNRWIPRQVNSPHKGKWRGALVFSLICVWIKGWVNSRENGDLRRYRAHYVVTVMALWHI